MIIDYKSQKNLQQRNTNKVQWIYLALGTMDHKIFAFINTFSFFVFLSVCKKLLANLLSPSQFIANKEDMKTFHPDESEFKLSSKLN